MQGQVCGIDAEGSSPKASCQVNAWTIRDVEDADLWHESAHCIGAEECGCLATAVAIACEEEASEEIVDGKHCQATHAGQ